MKENPNPLEYHYEVGLKLDYFILSMDVALLGWTVVNTNWLPNATIYKYLLGAFWLLLVLSIIFGIIRQLYNGMIFGLNYHYLHEAELAEGLEKVAAQGGYFTDRKTGEVSTSEEFMKKFAEPHRAEETAGKMKYERYSNKAKLFANLTLLTLVTALVLLALVRISML